MYRESWMTYLHYKENGDMVDDEAFLVAHGETGVGQYDALWEKIEAEWYMAASDGMTKGESAEGGFEVSYHEYGDYLLFPLVKNVPTSGSITFAISQAHAGSAIELRANSATGVLLTSCALPEVSGDTTCVSCPFSYEQGLAWWTMSTDTVDLYLVYSAAADAGVVTSDTVAHDFLSFAPSPCLCFLESCSLSLLTFDSPPLPCQAQLEVANVISANLAEGTGLVRLDWLRIVPP
jgi:hypothetical protein